MATSRRGRRDGAGSAKENAAIPSCGLGGFARVLASELTPGSLNNGLSREANVTLFSADDVAASVNILFEHLAQSKELRELALQPVKWNPGLGAVIDHRDGTVDVEATEYILQAVA
jgi:hypothetical protein